MIMINEHKLRCAKHCKMERDAVRDVTVRVRDVATKHGIDVDVVVYVKTNMGSPVLRATTVPIAVGCFYVVFSVTHTSQCSQLMVVPYHHLFLSSNQ